MISYAPYGVIFYNSVQSNLLLSLRSENAWFAALSFGGYNMVLATVLAFVGSVLGLSANYGVGYYISRWRDEMPVHSETKYQRGVRLFSKYLFWIMAIPPIPYLEGIPGISFMPFFIFVSGMFHVPPKKAIGAIALGRVLYYGYFLCNF